MTPSPGLSLSIAIPVYATPEELLRRCLVSVARAKAAIDEVFLVLDGPQPAATLAAVDAATVLGFTIIRNEERIGMVANWNACLALGRGPLMHVMHADDEIADTFYDAVRRAAAGPNVALIAAGRSPSPASRARMPSDASLRQLSSNSAATYLLSSHKPPAGSFVIRRDYLRALSPWFDSRFPYSPDEDLHLRIVSRGDLALIERRLYRESRHDAQARYETWHQPDFASAYFGARSSGAASHGRSVRRGAIRETSRRLYSVGRVLADEGDVARVTRLIATIRRTDRKSWRDMRFWVLTIFVRMPAVNSILRHVHALSMRLRRDSDGK